MDFLGVGPMEVFFILIIALIVLGPRDMVKAGRTLGRALNKIVRSPTWSAMKQTTQVIRTLPTQLMREANLEDSIREINEVTQDIGRIEADVRQVIQQQHSEIVNSARDAIQAGEMNKPSFTAWTTPVAHKPPPSETSQPPNDGTAPASLPEQQVQPTPDQANNRAENEEIG